MEALFSTAWMSLAGDPRLQKLSAFELLFRGSWRVQIRKTPTARESLRGVLNDAAGQFLLETCLKLFLQWKGST